MAEPRSRAVRFDHYGDRSVLYLADVPVPGPAEGEVVVRVKAAGINPGESKIREGALHGRFPATFPSGEGSDLAGIVHAVGGGVEDLAVGDEVLGYSWRRSSHADFVAVPANQLVRKPPSLSWEVAGSLYVVGCTAYAAVRAVDPRKGESVAVSAAAGGVGGVAVQLVHLRGALALGIASEPNREWLESKGARFVAYGDELAARLLAAASTGVAAFVDCYGPPYVRLAVDLEIPVERINTIVISEDARQLGVKMEGSAAGSSKEVLAEMADLAASGAVEIPIAARYPLERVADAFGELEQGHTRGKIVLFP